MSNSLQPHELQHTRLPYFSLSLGVCSNSRPLSRWYHPTISSSVVPFSSCPQSYPASGLTLCHPLLFSVQSFPTSGSFSINRLFLSDGQSIGASVSASVLPINIQGWFPLGLTSLISLLSKGLSRVFSSSSLKHQFFGAQSSWWSKSHIHTWLLEKLCLWLDRPLFVKSCLYFLICCVGW